MSVEQNTADREARNEYLSNLDEVWESCREAVEVARNEYEDALDLARMSYESDQAEAAAEYGRAIDEAWNGYKKQVADTPSTSRKDAIAEARAAYNEKAASIRESYELGALTQHDDYVQASHDARVTYQTAVDAAFTGYLGAIQAVGDFVSPGAGTGSGTSASAAAKAPAAANGGTKAAAPAAAAKQEIVLDDLDAGDGDESLLELAEALAARSTGGDSKGGQGSK
jgi:hypothetical protein